MQTARTMRRAAPAVRLALLSATRSPVAAAAVSCSSSSLLPRRSLHSSAAPLTTKKKRFNPIVAPPSRSSRPPTPPSLANRHLTPPPAESEEEEVYYYEEPPQHVEIDRRGVKELGIISVATIVISGILGAVTAHLAQSRSIPPQPLLDAASIRRSLQRSSRWTSSGESSYSSLRHAPPSPSALQQPPPTAATTCTADAEPAVVRAATGPRFKSGEQPGGDGLHFSEPAQLQCLALSHGAAAASAATSSSPSVPLPPRPAGFDSHLWRRFTLQPSPVTIPVNSIKLTYLHSFLSLAECAALLSLAAATGFARSETTVGISPNRTSFSSDIPLSDSLVRAVRQLAVDLCGGRERIVDIAVVRYRAVYLNDVEGGGGETEFTRLGVKFKPSRGDALFWENRPNALVSSYHRDGEHAGKPPFSGVKYGLNIWIDFAD